VSAKLPSQPLAASTIMDAIKEFQRRDAAWDKGRLFSLVYHHSEEDLSGLLRDAYMSCFSLNALSSRAFPSLARMQQEIVEMTADLLGMPGAPGSFTSGGSESNFLAVKTARDRARALCASIRKPEIILPASAHPSFNKAAHYLDVRAIRVPVDAAQRADVGRVREAITRNTILLVGSAPSWPHGIVDPIEGLATLARQHDLMLHVDACVGGFVLPFARRLGRQVPNFDLSVDGVTSISADIHKFGYAPKGASVVLYRSQEISEFQPFSFDDWTGGSYSVPTFAGSRPGGAIAAAWAALNGLGEAGYVRLTDRCLRATARFIEGIESVNSFHVVGNPQFNLFAFGSHTLDIARIWAGMSLSGWGLGLQGKPPSSIHLTVAPDHDRVVEEFITDLRRVVKQVTTGEGPAMGVETKYN
jgi:sphinganine-1-phosphate aldolase